ncbi:MULTISPECIES: hypothetical protein [unclassified Myroides]|uniref:hypothetical protein n=1 Tax=unclassified Myroides TaxID=2642485 RepID=UPI0015FBED4C|nr:MULTISPECIES: hypothetical protein [unclassified Myroides]MBB1148817.1 hypothetical protein [Myroides sp. NP-2]MDM1406527.1 hypothetical protein [Myroides sp. DF42-4-2]
MRLEDTDRCLYVEDDVNGESVYYLDPALTLPYTGVIYTTYRGKIESEAVYFQGLKNGLEYVYNEEGEIIQIDECRGNVQFGISKEFENNRLSSISINYNNSWVKVLYVGENCEIIDTQKYYYDVTKGDEVPQGNASLTRMPYECLPSYIRLLLELSDQELVDYEFKDENPYLRPPYTI